MVADGIQATEPEGQRPGTYQPTPQVADGIKAKEPEGQRPGTYQPSPQWRLVSSHVIGGLKARHILDAFA